MAAIKFNSLTFDLKDLLLICSFVAGYFNFKSEQKEMINELKADIAQIVSDNKLQEVKFNAKFDMLSKPTSQKTDKTDSINFVAVLHDSRIQIKSERIKRIKLV